MPARELLEELEQYFLKTLGPVKQERRSLTLDEMVIASASLRAKQAEAQKQEAEDVKPRVYTNI